MNIKNTEEFLDKLDYIHLREGDKLTIKMDYNHQVFIDFKTPKKVFIKDQLTTWNFITGSFKMSIRRAFLTNLLFNIILSTLISFVNIKLGITVFIILLVWLLFWSIFYISKYENLRYFISNSNNQTIPAFEA